jgi:hypothetical protein
MKPIKIVYVMYESSSSTYAESYFIPLIEGIARQDDSVLFIRVTEKNTSHSVTLTKRSMQFMIVNAPIGRFNISEIKLLRRVIRHSFTDTQNLQTLVIGRGINSFWVCLVLGLMSKWRLDFIYDSDGLSADEVIEFRRSLKSLILYIPARIMEACLLWRADLVLTRSNWTKEILQKRMPIARNRRYVELNNGCDPSKYGEVTAMEKEEIRRDLGLSRKDMVFVYLGSYGPQYEFEMMLNAFRKIHLTNFKKKLLIFVPANDVAPVKKLVEKHDIDLNSYIVRNTGHSQTPILLAAADFGFSLRQESFSMKHVKPLKTREYLFSGLSVIYSVSTGDAAGLPKEIGFALKGTDASEMKDLSIWVERRMLKQEYFYKLARQFAIMNLSIDKDISLLSEASQNVFGRDNL